MPNRSAPAPRAASSASVVAAALTADARVAIVATGVPPDRSDTGHGPGQRAEPAQEAGVGLPGRAVERGRSEVAGGGGAERHQRRGRLTDVTDGRPHGAPRRLAAERRSTVVRRTRRDRPRCRARRRWWPARRAGARRARRRRGASTPTPVSASASSGRAGGGALGVDHAGEGSNRHPDQRRGRPGRRPRGRRASWRRPRCEPCATARLRRTSSHTTRSSGMHTTAAASPSSVPLVDPLGSVVVGAGRDVVVVSTGADDERTRRRARRR